MRVDKKTIKNGLLTGAGIALLLFSVAIMEGATNSFLPKWLLFIVAFSSPFFLYRMWLLYQNREELQSVYFMSESMMRDIKMKKGWGKYKKEVKK